MPDLTLRFRPRVGWQNSQRAVGIFKTSMLLLMVLLLSTGCATTSTLSQPVHERKPLVMSGVRLDLAKLRNEAGVTEKFGVSAPAYPLLDLPFSAVLDFFVLGYTVPVALVY